MDDASKLEMSWLSEKLKELDGIFIGWTWRFGGAKREDRNMVSKGDHRIIAKRKEKPKNEGSHVDCPKGIK